MEITAYRDRLSELRPELLGVLADVYEDPSALIDRELEACDTIVVARDGAALPAAFLMLAFGELTAPDGTSIRTLYAGPGAERADLRGSGAAMHLPLYVVRHLLDPSVERYLFWSAATTAAGYLATARALPDLEPASDGSYSAAGGTLAALVRRQLGYPQEGHPFLLRALESGTRLRTAEHERNRAITEAHRLVLFERLGVDWDAGDAVLILGWLPRPEVTS